MKLTKDWIVGFIEGEGSFYSQKQKHYKDKEYVYPRFSISQKDKEILEKVRDFLEMGHITKHKSSYQGKNLKNPQNKKYDSCYKLQVQNKKDCKKLANMLEGNIRSKARKEDFEWWKELF